MAKLHCGKTSPYFEAHWVSSNQIVWYDLNCDKWTKITTWKTPISSHDIHPLVTCPHGLLAASGQINWWFYNLTSKNWVCLQPLTPFGLYIPLCSISIDVLHWLDVLFFLVTNKRKENWKFRNIWAKSSYLTLSIKMFNKQTNKQTKTKQKQKQKQTNKQTKQNKVLFWCLVSSKKIAWNGLKSEKWAKIKPFMSSSICKWMHHIHPLLTCPHGPHAPSDQISWLFYNLTSRNSVCLQPLYPSAK